MTASRYVPSTGGEATQRKKDAALAGDKDLHVKNRKCP